MPEVQTEVPGEGGQAEANPQIVDTAVTGGIVDQIGDRAAGVRPTLSKEEALGVAAKSISDRLDPGAQCC
ncbi:MAG: hypothetical protein Q8P62_04105 [Candidatus Peregrinibacteria bacterium]|nr:hypothetical protein [Candidatus Peregrinibacteria bacterium]